MATVPRMHPCGCKIWKVGAARKLVEPVLMRNPRGKRKKSPRRFQGTERKGAKHTRYQCKACRKTWLRVEYR